MANTRRRRYYVGVMDEGRKRVIGIMAAILTAMHMRTADDLFGTPQGSPRTDRLIAASIQWDGAGFMRKVDMTDSEMNRGKIIAPAVCGRYDNQLARRNHNCGQWLRASGCRC